MKKTMQPCRGEHLQASDLPPLLQHSLLQIATNLRILTHILDMWEIVSFILSLSAWLQIP